MSTDYPPSNLSSPVGALMRPSSQIAPEDSLDRAVHELRRSGNGLLPVVAELTLLGVITEEDVARALGEGVDPGLPASIFMRPATTIRAYATGAEALRMFDAGVGPTLVVTDDLSRLMGLLSPSDLFPRRLTPPRPSLIGGMATPFGVYLTNGSIGAGVSDLALVATGALLFFLLTVSQLAAASLITWIATFALPIWLVEAMIGIVPIAVFLLLMRLIPLSGTHAAEHMVVHALERGEELKSDIVRRMPRVHPRCGTNLAVGAMLFLGVFYSNLIENGELRFLAAALITMLFWRRLGSLVQFYITTKPPKERQIRSGLKAATELLDRYSRSRVSVPSVPLRIWRSGMLQVMAGSALCSLVVLAVAWLIESAWNLKLPI